MLVRLPLVSVYDQVHVFVDESGDLGFSERSSRHFIVVCLATDQPYLLARIVRRAYRRFGLKGEDVAEFKFNRSGESARRIFLEGIARTESMVGWFGVRKSRLPFALRSEADEVWQLAASTAVSDIISGIHSKRFQIVFDRRSLKSSVRGVLAHRLEKEVSLHHAGYFAPAVRVSHLDSQHCDGLKVADHVAGAVFQSVERADDHYLALLKDNVIRGRLL